MRYTDIATDQDYHEAVAYFRELMQSPQAHEHIAEINQLGELIETYEILHRLDAKQNE